jgi:thiamine-phosphate pyrophosphorylase
LDIVVQRLPRQTVSATLATEHLLLALVAGEHPVGQWLRQHRLDPRELELEISRLYGYSLQVAGDRLQGTEDGEDGLEGQDQGVGAAHEQPSPPKTASPSPVACNLLRAVDAAANRAREGLRVVEDYVRFVLDDRHLTERLKQLRHRLTAALEEIAYHDRLAGRETQADVGTTITLPSEQHRANDSDLLAANFGRLQEALRSLEEFGKLVSPGMAAIMERLRYETYTLHRAAESTVKSVERLGWAQLYVLVDGRSSVGELETLVRTLVVAGVHVIQFRDKKLDDRELIGRARLVRSLTQGTSTLFVMNDRPDLAVLARADGVHVGQEELTVKDARAIVGPRRLVGVSTHSLEQARQAVLDGADYLGVGPTFPSTTKQFERFPGLDLVRAVASEIRMPAFAIGGIGLDNVSRVIQAGLRRVAVSGAILGAANPGAAAAELLTLLGEGGSAG